MADPTVLAVLSSSPWRSVQDLVADAKKRPREIAYSSSGSYGASHVPMNMFTQAAGIELQHVPYRGGGPALTALIGNQVATLASAPGPLAPHIAAGTVRVLASWAGARTPELADVPTFRELGYGDVEFYIWSGFFAPRATPSAAINVLREATRKAANTPEFKTAMDKMETPIAYLDADEFQKFWDKDAKRLIAGVRNIGKVQ